MPTILDPNASGRGISSSEDLGYTYPDGTDLRPGSAEHKTLVKEVYTRAQESSNEMSKRYSSWKKVDQTLTAYIRLDESEEVVKNKDDRKPVSIVVPYSYATLETILTYFVSAFLENPIFRYEGSGPEDMIGGILLEKVIEQQTANFKVALNLHTMYRDSLSYGMGIVTPTWDKRWGWKTVVQDSGFMSALLGRFINVGQERVREETILFEGNRLKNVDPYMFLPDPNVPIHDVQQGEFVGWIESTNYVKLLELEKNDPNIFNVKYLKDIGQGGSSQFNKSKSESGRGTKFGSGTGVSASTTTPIDVIWMYWTLIPKDQKMGKSEYPEKWLIGLAADKYIICAKPMTLNHNMYPVAVCAPDFDGYSSTPVSRLELMYGMQEGLDWLFNCYDDQTEVLTDRGWVFLSETQSDDKVATVDPETKEFWFEKPSRWDEYDYEGSLLNFKSSRLDICVTPNHNMFTKKRNSCDWEFMTAIDLAVHADKEYKTLGNLNWCGDSQPKAISFKEIKPIRDRGRELRYKDATIDPMVLAGFLGWFLSEGSISHGKESGSYAICIKQSKMDYFKDIDDLMKVMPFHVTTTYDEKKQATQWTITDKRFYEWLRDNCYVGGTNSEHKKVPDFVRTWDEFHLNLLFERAMWGDGYWMPGYSNLGKYGSRSKDLVDGMQEIALRLGYFSHTKVGETPNGLPFYMLNISTSETNPTIASRNVYKVDYKGKVYCFENSTHLTITRRNGKVAVQGQSHIANVRKAINDMLIVDPSLINMADLEDPKPGKLIRMRRAAWGRGVQNAVMQLPVQDITRQHISDASTIVEFMQRTSAATDSLSGMVRKGGERVTASESQGTRTSALSRLTKAAKIASLQAMQDIGYMFASHTQQLMTKDVWVKATGTWQDVLRKEYGEDSKLVTPYDLAVDYDIVVKDGSVQGGEYSESWVEIFRILAAQPQLYASFDMVRVFKHIARMMGAKDVNEFAMQTGAQVPPVKMNVDTQENIEKGVQQGNMVPVESYGPGGSNV